MLKRKNVIWPKPIKKIIDALYTLNPKRVVDGQPLEHDFQGNFIQVNLMSNRLLRNRLIYWRKRNRVGVHEWAHGMLGIPYGMVDILLHECSRRTIPIEGKLLPKCRWSKRNPDKNAGARE